MNVNVMIYMYYVNYLLCDVMIVCCVVRNNMAEYMK